MYPEEIVKPMKLELTNSGFSELTSSEDVKSALEKEGTTLIALFKDGELVHMVERHHIEGREADLIADNLIQAYNEFC